MVLGKIRGVQLAKASSQHFRFTWFRVAKNKGIDVVEDRGRSLLTNLTAAAMVASIGDCLWKVWS
jgi:hypothetical protein